jgi:hypothetical protein
MKTPYPKRVVEGTINILVLRDKEDNVLAQSEQGTEKDILHVTLEGVGFISIPGHPIYIEYYTFLEQLEKKENDSKGK